MIPILLTALLGGGVAVFLLRGDTIWEGGDPQLFHPEGPRVDCAVVAEVLELDAKALEVLGGDVSCSGFEPDDGAASWSAVGAQGRLDIAEDEIAEGQGQHPSIGIESQGDVDRWEDTPKGSVVVELSSGVHARVMWSSGPGEGWDVLDRWVWQNSHIHWVTETDTSWLSVDLTISSPDPREAISMADGLLTR